MPNGMPERLMDEEATGGAESAPVLLSQHP